MNKIEKLINELEAKIPYFKRNNLEISNVAVGWQIEHSFKTISLML